MNILFLAEFTLSFNCPNGSPVPIGYDHHFHDNVYYALKEKGEIFLEAKLNCEADQAWLPMAKTLAYFEGVKKMRYEYNFVLVIELIILDHRTFANEDILLGVTNPMLINAELYYCGTFLVSNLNLD